MAVDIAAEDPLAPDRWTAEAGGGGSPAETATALAELLAATADDSATEVEVGDVLAGLTRLRLLREQLADWEPHLIGAARSRGASWADIAPALGVASRQAAERRYLRLNPNPDPNLTGEQRVQAARDQRAGDRAVAGWARHNSARLRRLAAQITSLDDLDARARPSVDRLEHALGADDSAELLEPLAEAASKLRDSHPALATQVAQIGADAEQLRDDAHHRAPTRNQTTRGEPL